MKNSLSETEIHLIITIKYASSICLLFEAIIILLNMQMESEQPSSLNRGVPLTRQRGEPTVFHGVQVQLTAACNTLCAGVVHSGTGQRARGDTVKQTTQVILNIAVPGNTGLSLMWVTRLCHVTMWSRTVTIND